MRNKLLATFVLLISLPVISYSAEKLIFALDLIRHGDRTPIDKLTTVNYEWQEGLGQLTATGMRQEFVMGKLFRKKYIEQLHLLPSHYQHGTMYVYSTNVERTLMSAQSLLMGLYPPGTGPRLDERDKTGLPWAYQPIPVHTAPADVDRIILHRPDDQEEAALLEKYVYSSAEWRQKEDILKNNFQHWSEVTGFKITRLQHLEALADTLKIHRIYHAPMPQGLSDDDITTIIKTGDWVFAAKERPNELGVAYSRQLMTNIASFLQKGSEQKQPLKYVLLSAHDSTIMRALSVMEAPLSTPPPYASDLNFSLYESGSQNYLVKITYNGSPVFIPACGGSVCALQKFIDVAAGGRS